MRNYSVYAAIIRKIMARIALRVPVGKPILRAQVALCAQQQNPTSDETDRSTDSGKRVDGVSEPRDETNEPRRKRAAGTSNRSRKKARNPARPPRRAPVRAVTAGLCAPVPPSSPTTQAQPVPSPWHGRARRAGLGFRLPDPARQADANGRNQPLNGAAARAGTGQNTP